MCFGWSYAIATFYQLFATKTLKLNPAVITLAFAFLASTMQLALNLVYIIVVTKNDPSFTVFDLYRGPLLGASTTTTSLVLMQVLIMWVEVVEKSKSLSKSSKQKCGKIAIFKGFLNGQSFFVAIIAVILIIISRSDLLNIFLLVIVIELIGLYLYCGRMVISMIGGPKAGATKSSTVLAIETARNPAVGLLVAFVICAIGFVGVNGGPPENPTPWVSF
eukprot:FR740788.1.p1 GENE.FR740788.1~~FR740788.1.p1  ORF type:complete len:219 (+),score=14.02 FR740788.1:298-954(+)